MNQEAGFSFLEILITMTVLMILTSVAMPLGKTVSKRTHEVELRQQLRMMRSAIDRFKLDWNRDGDSLMGLLCAQNQLTCKEVTGLTGYPKSLDVLLKVELSGETATVQGKKYRRYLRKIPIDPLTDKSDWKLRCYSDPPDASSWCGEDIYDISSASPDRALDGTSYKDW